MACELKAYLKDIIATVAAANIILKPPVFIFGGILHYDSFKLFLAFHEEISFGNGHHWSLLSTWASLSFFKASVFTFPLGPVLACSTLINGENLPQEQF